MTTAQKIKFSIKDFFSKCDQVNRKLRIWSQLLKKSLIENFVFRAVDHALRIGEKKPKKPHATAAPNKTHA